MAKYGCAVSQKLTSLFKETAQNFDIKQPPFFRLKNDVDITIPPALYQTRLESSLVEITFSLRHYYLAAQRNHSFSVSIQSLCVLSLTEILTSPTQTTIPTKRKPTNGPEDSDDKQPSSKKGKKKGNMYPQITITSSLTQIAEHDSKNYGLGSSTTEDESDEHSILETLKDGIAAENRSV